MPGRNYLGTKDTTETCSQHRLLPGAHEYLCAAISCSAPPVVNRPAMRQNFFPSGTEGLFSDWPAAWGSVEAAPLGAGLCSRRAHSNITSMSPSLPCSDEHPLAAAPSPSLCALAPMVSCDCILLRKQPSCVVLPCR